MSVSVCVHWNAAVVVVLGECNIIKFIIISVLFFFGSFSCCLRLDGRTSTQS